MNTRTRGFTVIELLAIIVIVGAASILFFVQKGNVVTASDDQQRKVAINAMYYSLEEVFHPTNGYYPVTIDAKTLPSVDPNLLSDPQGVMIGDSASDYRYEPINCTDSKCKSYSIRTTLHGEADFVKTSRNN